MKPETIHRIDQFTREFPLPDIEANLFSFRAENFIHRNEERERERFLSKSEILVSKFVDILLFSRGFLFRSGAQSFQQILIFDSYCIKKIGIRCLPVLLV